jgi:hypothetical protein
MIENYLWGSTFSLPLSNSIPTEPALNGLGKKDFSFTQWRDVQIVV